MNNDDLLRYSRHIFLPQVDIEGQEKINLSKVLVVGLGGLGSPMLYYLAVSGVGTIYICDNDVVELSNLQRQILYKESDIGKNKAQSAASALSEFNSKINIVAFDQRLSEEELNDLVTACDVVADCSDNLTTRQQLNAMCLDRKTPLVSAAAIRFEGQLSVFDFRDSLSPCYNCLMENTSDLELSCSESGVFSAVVGVLGLSQALEVLKILGQFGEPLIGELALFDGLKNKWSYLKIKRKKECEVCAGKD